MSTHPYVGNDNVMFDFREVAYMCMQQESAFREDCVLYVIFKGNNMPLLIREPANIFKQFVEWSKVIVKEGE